MKAILVLVLMVCGCSKALTDDAVVLLDRESDLEMAVEALERYQPHVGVSLAVTRDAKVFATWDTEERWQVKSVPVGTVFDGDALCVFDADDSAVGAVTHHPTKTIYVGECWPKSRPYVIAHEIGHMVGASDCEDGVMSWANPATLNLADVTKDELRGMY
ncbi:MAG: hypothetical protein IPO08_20680 [Xanthomonadales bacterium]|nr:hypothetical protein [Xanthomonadales bacterium]